MCGVLKVQSNIMPRPISSTAIPCMDDKDPDKKFVCPYNKYHLISAKIYPTHVANCRKMYTGDRFAICPFNARHEFPAVEYDYHLASCPDKNFIEKEISSVPAPNVPPVNHFPDWDQPSPTEDWDAEADQPSFSISGSIVENDERTAYDVIEDYQTQLQDQATALPSRPVVNGDMSGLSKAQKKNFKRAQKRRENRVAEEDDEEEEEEEQEEDEHEMTAEEKEQKLRQIAQEYAIPGRQVAHDAFVDWVSILNQYCQQNKINQPKYAEAHNSLGGFGFSVTVTTERFLNDTLCNTKKASKHSAARAALLGLNIAVSTPDPCRAPHHRGGNVERGQELEANRQWLEHNFQSNQQRIIPGLSEPTSSNHLPRPQTPPSRPSNSSGSASAERLNHQMAGVNINQNPDDEWQVVGRRSRDSARVPGAPANNNALRLAGRGRGRGSTNRS